MRRHPEGAAERPYEVGRVAVQDARGLLQAEAVDGAVNEKIHHLVRSRTIAPRLKWLLFLHVRAEPFADQCQPTFGLEFVAGVHQRAVDRVDPTPEHRVDEARMVDRSAVGTDQLDLVGVAVFGPRNAIDKILKGARMHRELQPAFAPEEHVEQCDE